MKSAITNSKTKPIPDSSMVGVDLTKTPKTATIREPKTKAHKDFTIVAIGASAGGLEAITQLLQNLSPNTGMAFIYVQHLSPDHKSMLPSLLSNATDMKVQDVEDMEKMEPNNVYIIPYNKEIEVTDGHIRLIPRSKVKTYNKSIDVLFSSLAETHKKNIIGIVLSGSASDGTKGLKDIKLAGGITFAQDDSAKFRSMPLSAIAEGVVDFVLSPKEMAIKLSEIGEGKISNVKTPPEDEIENDDPNLKFILHYLYKMKGVDFSYYKMSTIKRRTLRRILINKTKSLNAYAELLTHDEGEVDLLYQDLLINVTEFFRDEEAFVVLKKTVLPQLLKSKAIGETLRIWVTACATGEEAYSIAMLLLEILDRKAYNVHLQIFASDLSVEAISEARQGEYPIHRLKNVSPKRLQRFFTKTKDTYSVSKELREICTFAPHNILSDPPFSRMDLISCRNLLIYFDIPAQKKVIATIHHALNDQGFLMLGKSETVGASTQLFGGPIDKSKIYARKKNIDKRKITVVEKGILFNTPATKNIVASFPKKTSAVNTLGSAFDAVLLAQYVPASVVINHDMEILQFRGSTSLYLQQAAGKASFNILKMAHVELTFELRNAIHHCIKTKQIVRKERIEINRNKSEVVLRMVDLEVSPLKVEGEDDLLMVVFAAHHIEMEGATVTSDKKKSATERRIMKLEEEIVLTRQDMAAITHDQEAANEELQCANEEVVSSNEELQSLNEELETSKEEIESTNEELISTNHELQLRNQQVEELYTYYETILSTIHEPMLILNKEIRIKSANKSFCKTFHVTEEECIGVPLYQLGDNQWDIPLLRELLEEIVPKNKHFQNFEVDVMFPIIGHKAMLLNAHRIVQQNSKEELIVLTISDITEIKKLAVELQLKETKVLEIQLEAEKKAMKKIEEANNGLMEARKNADLKTQIAEDAMKAKQQFLSNMSHEIRTPMNAIIGFTNVMKKTRLDEAQKEYIDAIKVSGDALIILIDDILDLAKVDAGKMHFEKIPFSLSVSIALMLQLFDTKIKEKNLALVTDYDESIPQILVGDPMRLRQIVLNLVSNAVKFTMDGRITMRIRMVKEDEKQATIEFALTDTGIGIPEGRLGFIFNDFEQANTEIASSYGGSGLGLAIVKQFVELQGGSIFVKSEVGKGSTFGFLLSFDKTDSEVETTKDNELLYQVPVKEIAKKTRVLAVEDITLNQLLVKIMLTEFGFDVDIAANGKIAVEKMAEHDYDIILMDLQMPEMNGFETTAHIRNVMHSQIPIIATTADVTTVDFEKCIAAGMNDYISKPIDEHLLYSKMMVLLKKVNE